MIPRALYRLQFHSGFGFDDAAAIAPYLARLGISHVYASSWLKARRGSTHGYDVADHTALNPELGDADAFARMLAAFRANGLWQVLDLVPNHMGIGGQDNALWLDVLEWGPQSPYAAWFDIDWAPERPDLRGRLLVPFLGDSCAREVERGNLRLAFDAAEGSFAVWAYDTHKLPVAPADYARILAAAGPALRELADAFADLPRWRPQMHARARALKARLAALAAGRADIAAAIEAAVLRCTGAALHALIETQHWRPAHAAVAGDDINYRRFFTISDLAGLRIELPEVFDHAHRLVLALLGDGTLDGLRIDHIDGLLEPAAYLHRLRAAAGRPFHLWVEKILGRQEELPQDWPVDGTTGYEFVNLMLGLLVDRAGEAGFTRTYQTFTGETRCFAAIVHACKQQIMQEEMAAELHALARAAAAIARQDVRTADLTANQLRRALQEFIAFLPLYRTYLDTTAAPSPGDRRLIETTLAAAHAENPRLGAVPFDFLGRLLTGDLAAERDVPAERAAIRLFAARVQQFTGPVMAKGLEDTAFYRYNRFVALNEVGGAPDLFGIDMDAFHAANRRRAERWPDSMLGTATHDTKRGEDTRARLAALSGFPDEWDRLVRQWSDDLRASDAGPPDRNDEYLLYQLLLGVWPPDLLDPAALTPCRVDALRIRVHGAMTKSMREAKLRTSWGIPDAGYEAAMLRLIDRALDVTGPNRFLGAFLPFAAKLARLGARNSLLQTALKLTLPGVPDIYQGAELWDLSLVDPDNRRPVDYAQRAAMLEHVAAALAADRPAAMARLAQHWQDGGAKLATILALLAFRRAQPALLARGSYAALDASGPGTARVCAFLRRHQDQEMVVVGARLPAGGAAASFTDDSAVVLPGQSAARFTDLLTGRGFAASGDRLAVAHLLDVLPVAVLVPAAA